MQIQISWLLQKTTDLDLHFLQRQSVSRFSRTRVKSSETEDKKLRSKSDTSFFMAQPSYNSNMDHDIRKYLHCISVSQDSGQLHISAVWSGPSLFFLNHKHCRQNQWTMKTLISKQGPVVQSVVSLTSSLRVISLTVLADSIYNILIFFCWKNVSSFCTAKATHIFSAKNIKIFSYHSM